MYYVIRSMSMMQYLIREGFDIQKVSDHEDNPKFKVFLFLDTPDLRSAMDGFTNQNLSK